MFMNIIYVIFIAILVVSFITGVLVTKFDKNLSYILSSSSGAALSATEKLIYSGARGNIVVILPDRGDRYFSKNLYE